MCRTLAKVWLELASGSIATTQSAALSTRSLSISEGSVIVSGNGLFTIAFKNSMGIAISFFSTALIYAIAVHQCKEQIHFETFTLAKFA